MFRVPFIISKLTNPVVYNYLLIYIKVTTDSLTYYEISGITKRITMKRPVRNSFDKFNQICDPGHHNTIYTLFFIKG